MRRRLTDQDQFDRLPYGTRYSLEVAGIKDLEALCALDAGKFIEIVERPYKPVMCGISDYVKVPTHRGTGLLKCINKRLQKLGRSPLKNTEEAIAIKLQKPKPGQRSFDYHSAELKKAAKLLGIEVEIRITASP